MCVLHGKDNMFDAAINRDTNNLVSASLELFRNGDVSVTTNCVAYPPSEASAEGGSMRGAYLPRRLGRGASPRRPLLRGKSVAISSAP